MYVCTRNVLLVILLFVLVNTKYLRWINTSMVDSDATRISDDCIVGYYSDKDVCVLIK